MKAGQKIAYRPHGDSAAARAIAVLKDMPPGSEVGTEDLARLVGFKITSAASLFEPAVRAGVLVKRLKYPGDCKGGCLWSLGDGVPLPPREPKKPRTASSEGASARFNFRVNADVPSHAVRLASMHHPAAKPAAAEPVIPAGVKVQRGPSWTHDPRVQCAPNEQPYGAGFAAAGPGRDVTTGRAWA